MRERLAIVPIALPMKNFRIEYQTVALLKRHIIGHLPLLAFAFAFSLFMESYFFLHVIVGGLLGANRSLRATYTLQFKPGQCAIIVDSLPNRPVLPNADWWPRVGNRRAFGGDELGFPAALAPPHAWHHDVKIDGTDIANLYSPLGPFRPIIASGALYKVPEWGLRIYYAPFVILSGAICVAQAIRVIARTKRDSSGGKLKG
jgi:hypothetical protein